MKCYRCDTDLIEKENASPEQIRLLKYRSEEHIIPNFCGGRLTSFDLLCAKCNSDLGTEVDGSLDKELLLHQMFRFELDRGKQKHRYILAYTKETNQEVLVKSNLDWKHFKPEYEISDDGQVKRLRCRDIDQAREILEGLKRKFPQIDIEETLKMMKEVEEFLPEKISFDHRTIGKPETMRAIAKIALNYFLYCKGDRIWVEDIIKYVCNSDVKNIYTTFYYSFMPIHKLGSDEISHILFLRGDPRKELLYCYIELFSVANFVVIINRNYTGEDFTQQYCYDVLSNQELKGKEIKLKLFTDLFKYLNFKVHYEETEDYIIDKVSRAFEILDRITPPREKLD